MPRTILIIITSSLLLSHITSPQTISSTTTTTATTKQSSTTASASTTPTPSTIDTAEKSDGPLCETDHDLLGQRLGCSCGISPSEGKKAAICVNLNIQTLPDKLNVSRHVRILDLSKNHIQSLTQSTFGDCEGLQELTLSRNNLSSITTVTCRRLKSLDLSWNKLSNLTNPNIFSNLTHLTHLTLSFNNLTLLHPSTFTPLKNLQVLNLASNPLGRELESFSDYLLSLENLPRLEDLDLSNTSLPTFPLSLINGTRNLKRLSLANNLLMSLPGFGVWEELEFLEYLDLSGNLFETLPPYGFNGLQRLEVLRVDRMPYLREIEQHAFAGLASLEELFCEKNRNLSFIHVLAFRNAPELRKELTDGDSHPRSVHLSDNNLNYIEYGLLEWKNMEWVELYRNPWICDCNLQWIAEFYKLKKPDAAVFSDPDFTCRSPHIFAGVAVIKVNPEEMLCYSSAATVAFTVAIILFGFLLFTFCSIFILNNMGMLPEWVRRWNIFGSGSSLPKYMRVNPKPVNVSRTRVVEQSNGKDDLEWDDYGGVVG